MSVNRSTQEMNKAPPAYKHVQFYKRWHAQRVEQGAIVKPFQLSLKPLGRLVRENDDELAIAKVEEGNTHKRLTITCNNEILWTSRHNTIEGALEFAKTKFEEILAYERRNNQVATHQASLFDTDEATSTSEAVA